MATPAKGKCDKVTTVGDCQETGNYDKCFRMLEPRVGVEPTTCRLRIGCSTTELPRPLIIKDLFPRSNSCVKLASNLRCNLSKFRRYLAILSITNAPPRRKRPLLH